MKHLRYLRYVILHKWWVLVAGVRLGPPGGTFSWIPWLIRLMAHDLSKFRPSEWLPYVDYFYGPPVEACGPCKVARQAAFDRAWLLHQHRNPHHWQHHLLREDDGQLKRLPMGLVLAREMVADWMGADRVITGRWEAAQWYLKNAHLIQLTPEDAGRVYALLGVSITVQGKLAALEVPIA